MWDLYLGLLLMLMPLPNWLGQFELSGGLRMLIYAGVVGLAMGAMWLGKRYITLPRMGRVKFGARRQARVIKVRWLLLGSVLLGLLVFFAFVWIRATRPPWLNLGVLLAAVYALNMLIVFSLGAYLLDFKRLYLYSVLYALPVPLDILARDLWGVELGPLAFIASALVMLTIGTMMLIRFVRAHPAPQRPLEEPNGR
jgi:hypothetical protein